MFHNSITTPSWAETGPGSICRNYSSGQSKRLALMLNSFNTMLAMEKISEYRIELAQLWLCIPPFRQESCRPSWMTWWWLARPVTSCYTDKTWNNKQDCWNLRLYLLLPQLLSCQHPWALASSCFILSSRSLSVSWNTSWFAVLTAVLTWLTA